MGDLTVTTAVPGARGIPQVLKMSLVMKRGKITDPVKRLGKVFNCSLKDTDSIKATRADLESWLRSDSKPGSKRTGLSK